MFEITNTTIGMAVLFYLVLAILFYILLRKPNRAIVVDSPLYEVKNCMILMLWLFMFSVFVLISGGFLSHQDTAWHQMAQMSEQTIPARLIIYLFFYPSYLIIGAGAWLFAKKRLHGALLDHKLKLAIIGMTAAPFMFLPSQDPELLIWSTEWWSLFYRTSYWLMMVLWISSLLYTIYRLSLRISDLTKRLGDY